MTAIGGPLNAQLLSQLQYSAGPGPHSHRLMDDSVWMTEGEHCGGQSLSESQTTTQYGYRMDTPDLGVQQ